MNERAAYAIVTLVCAAALALRERDRVMPVLALVASGLLVLMAFDWVAMYVRGINLPMFLWGLVALSGAVTYFKVDSKKSVAAAAILTVLGGLRLVGSIWG